jgi:DNA-binding NarL/FixJ family response regulator
VIRVVVVAASGMARAGLVAIVRADAWFECVGEAPPQEAGALIAALLPDVVLEQCEHGAAAERFDVPVVMLVDDPRAALAVEAMRGQFARERTGVGFGMLSRDATRDEIVGALVAAAAGLVALAPRALSRFGDRTTSGEALDMPAEPLTPREREVLAHLARGATNRTIAARLGISEHTVKFHIGSILAKLGASTRTEAVSRGLQLGMVML